MNLCPCSLLFKSNVNTLSWSDLMPLFWPINLPCNVIYNAMYEQHTKIYIPLCFKDFMISL